MASPAFIGVFPGQGSQHVGMAKDLFENFKIVQETFEEASDAISVRLKKLCFEGPDSELNLTENTQPALLTASVAAFRVARREIDFKPSAVAGHSLGEYSALAATGAIDFARAVRWVRARGQAMQQAVPVGEGSMAAILNADEKSIQALCQMATDQNLTTSETTSGKKAVCEPVNFNSPGQIVIAGTADAVAAAVSLVKTEPSFKGIKAIPLTVSAPFHSSLMKPARDAMEDTFKSDDAIKGLHEIVTPYFPNRTARLTTEKNLVFKLLSEQVDHAVLWQQSVEAILENFSGEVSFVEFGPGKVLQGLVKRIAQPKNRTVGILGLSDTAGLEPLKAAFLKGKSA
ncbi:MAG: ACP S-malonyltransferase [Bdellovibrionales bacterium]|nr:ACP S-malonyltransferase [Bdellovibrionales bacterium]